MNFEPTISPSTHTCERMKCHLSQSHQAYFNEIFFLSQICCPLCAAFPHLAKSFIRIAKSFLTFTSHPWPKFPQFHVLLRHLPSAFFLCVIDKCSFQSSFCPCILELGSIVVSNGLKHLWVESLLLPRHQFYYWSLKCIFLLDSPQFFFLFPVSAV